MGEKKITKEKFTNLVNKATEFGKKTVVDIKENQKQHEEHRAEIKQEKLLKKLNPLFEEQYRSDSFKIPNVIHIVDDAQRRDEILCDGAIGWLEKENNVEVFCLYDEWIEESGITFLPYAKCDAVYCVDPFDRKKFIDVSNAFERTTREKLSELSNVAFCLGAKRCSVEIVEESVATKVVDMVSSVSKVGKVSADNSSTNRLLRGGKDVSEWDGSNEPTRPELKWFANDESIKGLIEMRCSGNNAIKSKVLELKCASCATMSQSVALAVDKILPKKASASLKISSKSSKEHNSKLIFEIEF